MTSDNVSKDESIGQSSGDRASMRIDLQLTNSWTMRMFVHASITIGFLAASVVSPSEASTNTGTNHPNGSSVCGKMLNKNVIRWNGAGEAGDRFTIKFPKGLRSIEWKHFHNSGGAVNVYEAVMDFTGTGKKETVFRIEVYTSHSQSTSYILAAQDEAENIREKFSSVQGPNWDDELTAVIAALGRSRYYDSSETDAYKNWYTSSEIFIFQRQTYMVALSINNLGGPTAAIFKPKAEGTLELICQYDVKQSKKTWMKTFQSSRKACPTDESVYPKIKNEIMLPWEKLSDQISTVEINVPGWGGLRRLFRQTLVAGHYQNEYIFVGPEGKDLKDAVVSNVYSGGDPFSGLDIDNIFGRKFDDSMGIVQVPSEIVVVTYNHVEERAADSPPLGTTYYAIESGELEPICTFEQVSSPGK